VFALEAPLAIPSIERHIVQLTENMQLVSEPPINQRVRYRAASQPAFMLFSDMPPSQQLRLAALPYGYNPRTLAFAETLLQQEQDPVKLLQQVQAYFKSQPFSYTLSPPLLGQHTADEFLFDTRAGFCEHYASSFVILMRALGIPARVVTGYQGGEINSVDGFMAVRQSDAHAWAEVWLAAQGWVRVDPTAWVAPNRIARGVAPGLPDNSALPLFVRADIGWLRQLRFSWEAVNNGWNQWVLSFNSERQRDLLQRLGLSTPDWGTLSLLLLGISIISLAMISLLLWLRHIRIDPLSGLYSQYCAAIAARGVARLPHEGALDFSRRALQQLAREGSDQRAGETRIIKHAAQLYADLRYQSLEKAHYQLKFKQLRACVEALSHS
jgi:transglutaminase-like putative cysteine protease